MKHSCFFLEELQRQRRAETAEETTMRQKRVAALDRLRQNSRKKDAKRAPTRLAAALSASPATSPPPTQKKYGCLLDYACFEREADWSDPSSEDEFDPNGILPYCPWYKISSGRAKEMYDQSMQRVVEDAQAELAVKRETRDGGRRRPDYLSNRSEDIYLARSERDPSMTIKAPTESPDHLNQYLHLLLLTTTMGCFSPKQQAIPRWHMTSTESVEWGWASLRPGWVGKPMGEGSRRETLDDGSVQWGPTQQMSPEHLVIHSTRSRNVRDAKGKKHQKRNGGSRSIV
ncbi:hypothetical protein B0H11DRAFT_1917763 [Mycena galericulata]|nr:hypothetical protein B0H11DRAFT_1917763 [Mycena galericulata]